ncbi:hypothetical protein [Kineococcus gypseus]|uniref:hypothetical protein n=1 Tax=Kineococcus gypseus TaxID=1637102 RepID=UPI003D7CFDEC
MTGAAGGDERAQLLERYRELVGRELPAAAARGRWVLRADHCFARVLLDDAVGACWYDVLDRRAGAAHRQLDDAQLAHAVAAGERLLAEGDPLLRELDARSLRWRGKPPKRGGPLPPAGAARQAP